MLQYRRSPGERVADLVLYAIMWMVIAITCYPFVYVASMSISNPIHAIDQSVWLWPRGFSLEAYRRVFENPDVLRSYANTLYYTGAGTLINIALTLTAAYPLARRSFGMRKPIMMMIVLTMFFSGGLIPNFILIKELGLYNTPWAILLPTAASAFLIIVARTFLQGIPEELFESAKMDGANDLLVLFRIVLPLSKPIVAVLGLFYAVSHWNSYFPALLYLPDAKLQPLSLYLMKIVVRGSNEMLQGVLDADASMYIVQLKYAMIIVAVVPILLVYPFMQKHFVKGVMIGSVKE
ncbi:carbohydrate ABC transporter permease [Paenibacillus koleovorans]|uniref:carbohydrate ABC transporter permease n=1 Tax=Paenibacillus koleovorans TaxID=121608 RepID=UPI000FDCBC04|nr:carbohydrate ABC transporter permease [Paenibacillus koleovorans]